MQGKEKEQIQVQLMKKRTERRNGANLHFVPSVVQFDETRPLAYKRLHLV
jgi:hypothetical protein